MFADDQRQNGLYKTGGLHTAALICWLSINPIIGWAQENESPEDERFLQLEQRLERLEQTAGSQALLETASRLTRLQEDMRQLGGILEEQRHLLQKIDKTYKQLYTDLDTRLQVLFENDAISRQFGLMNQPVETELYGEAAGLTTDTAAEATDYESEAGAEPELAGTIVDVTEKTEKLAAEATLETAAETAVAGPVAGTETAAETAVAGPVAGTETAAETVVAGSVAGTETAAETVVTGPEAGIALPGIVATDEPGTDLLTMRVEYEKAFRFLKNGHYDHAIDALSKYLEKYPESPHRINARYWLAEAFFISGRYSLAVSEYKGFITDHADSPKYPQGLLKLGYSYDELGQGRKARHVLGQVINRFPDSAPALLARKRLEKMSR